MSDLGMVFLTLPKEEVPESNISTLISFVGTVRGIHCSPAMRGRITDTVHREFSKFLPKVDPSFYR